MTTPHLGKSIDRSPLQRAFLLIAVTLACFWLGPTPKAFAVSPAPDGGYPGFNTAEGDFALLDLTTGVGNTAVGIRALAANTTGNYNTAVGATALPDNTTGNYNTANGAQALLLNSTGNNNTASGVDALYSNTTGEYNTASGATALQFNSTGGNNTANGAQALLSNTTGSVNTATGVDALYSNTTGGYNTASGVDALYFNTTGGYNTATGVFALQHNTTGLDNTANGFSALQHNTTGNFNTASGLNSLFNNTTGSANTATGLAALPFNTTGTNNTADGVSALFHNTTGRGNIALGSSAGSTLTTGSNNIDIGNVGVAGEAAKIRIGTNGTQTAAFVAGIRGAAVTGAAVVVSNSGQLGVAPSSARFKDEIKPMDKASETILALKPVTFRYKHELDPDGIPQFGLVAEEVEKVNPDLVDRDAQGEPYTVRYEAVNAMLLNEFLKEHRKVDALKKDFQATITQQQKEIQTLTASLKEQAALIQKVSAQLDVIRPAPQMVLNSQ